jgi:hypothetical protein
MKPAPSALARELGWAGGAPRDTRAGWKTDVGGVEMMKLSQSIRTVVAEVPRSTTRGAVREWR